MPDDGPTISEEMKINIDRILDTVYYMIGLLFIFIGFMTVLWMNL